MIDDEKIYATHASLKVIDEAAYQRGFAAGAESMKERAAQVADHERAEAVANEYTISWRQCAETITTAIRTLPTEVK